MLSHKPWSGEAVFRLLLGIFATWCFGNILAALVFHSKIVANEDTRRMVGIIASVLFLQLGAVIWIAFFLREHHLSWKQGFGVGRPNSALAIILGVLAGMLVLPIAQELIVMSEWVMLHLHMQPVAQTVVQELQKPEVPSTQRAFLAIIAIVGAPIVEEMLFRGLLYTSIKQIGFPRFAFIGTSMLFAAFHMSVVTFVPLMFFAMILILLYESTDNLLAPIAAHSVFNFANFLLLVFQDEASRGLPTPSPIH